MKGLLNRLKEQVLRKQKSQSHSNTPPFNLFINNIARTLAADPDYSILLPTKSALNFQDAKTLKVGLYGNIANNQYTFAKACQRMGYRVDVVIEENFCDNFIMNRPFWEDVSFTCSGYDDGFVYASQWKNPGFVKLVQYDEAMGHAYKGRFSAASSVQTLYRETFGLPLSEDRALLLAQFMGHWPMIESMKAYDIIQFSSGAISLAPFCPKPYVVYPTGGDIHISPFQEDIRALLYRMGYRQARALFWDGADYLPYFDRLGLRSPRVFSPLLMDLEPDLSVDADAHEAKLLRSKWQRQVGGNVFIVSVCRQSWEWKGNDIFLKAFAQANQPEQRVVLLHWGDDIARSKALIHDLGIEGKVIWESLCSKPTLRQRQRAADLIVDQFAMPGFGTSVRESMALAKPVLISFDPSCLAADYYQEPPPFLVANNQEQIAHTLAHLPDLQALGQAHYQWIAKYHGPSQVSEYMQQFLIYANPYIYNLNPMEFNAHSDNLTPKMPKTPSLTPHL